MPPKVWKVDIRVYVNAYACGFTGLVLFRTFSVFPTSLAVLRGRHTGYYYWLEGEGLLASWLLRSTTSRWHHSWSTNHSSAHDPPVTVKPWDESQTCTWASSLLHFGFMLHILKIFKVKRPFWIHLLGWNRSRRRRHKEKEGEGLYWGSD